MSNYPKIVVTGFGPFGEISENSSSIAIRVLDTKWREISRNPENCLTILADVEVSYRRVDDLTEEIWQNMKPDLVVHVGVGAGLSEILLEMRSSKGFYMIPDVRGLCSDVCSFDKPLCTELALDGPRSALQLAGFNCSVSYDAGNYLCSYIYHRSLEHNSGRCLFVHLPDLSEEFTPEYLGEALLLLIVQLCKQCRLTVGVELDDYFLNKTKKSDPTKVLSCLD